MKTKMSIYALLLTGILMGFPVVTVEAQTDSPDEAVLFKKGNYQELNDSKKANLNWFNLGIGVSSGNLALGGSYLYQLKKGLLSCRYIYSKEIFFFGGKNPAESVWDFGVLYGLMGKAKYAMISLSAGLGVVGGVQRGEFLYSTGWMYRTQYYEKKEFLTIGIPVELQLFFTPFATVGFGIYGFANINAEKQFGGALLYLQFGKLR